jgi:hypothetical protein
MILLILFMAIQAADIWTTHKGLTQGDEEGNPLGRTLFARLGFWRTVLIVKGVQLTLAIAATAFGAWWAVALLCIIGAAVLWNNYRVLRT